MNAIIIHCVILYVVHIVRKCVESLSTRKAFEKEALYVVVLYMQVGLSITVEVQEFKDFVLLGTIILYFAGGTLTKELCNWRVKAYLLTFHRLPFQVSEQSS